MYPLASDNPMPETAKKRARGAPPKYPYAQMEVGDSFAFEQEEKTRIQCSSHAYGRRHGVRFTVRGDRIWRVE